MKIFEEYKKSLKMVDAEEPFDLLFYRPLGFIFVKIISPLPVTPNQISTAAMIFGIIAGFYYRIMTPEAVFTAGIFYSLYYLFDISDGQLARLKKNGTRLGRIIDGISDYVTHTAVYVGIALGFVSRGENALDTWLLTVGAMLSMTFQAILVDYYRNRYMGYAAGGAALYGDDLAEFKKEYEKLKRRGGKYLTRFIYWAYLKYLAVQSLFTKEKAEDNILEKYDREDFIRRNKPVMRLWTFMGTAMHVTLLIITSFLYRLEIYLWGIVTVLNAYAVLMLIIQAVTARKTKLNNPPA
jgi:phosphatidylglycerophosphate synthase